MTVSRDPDVVWTLRRGLCAGTIAALTAAGAFAATATAQVQLVPTPGADSGTQQQQPEAPTLSAPEGIAVESLDSVDAESVGALSGADALSPDLWQGLNRASIAALIDGLPSRIYYPAARDLARRLLLSAASIPPPDGDPPISVLRARVAALARLGFAADAAGLAASGSGALTGMDGKRVLAEAQLSALDLPGACGTAAGVGPGAADTFWDKLLAFCQAVAGQGEIASLSAQTLLDLGEEDDLYFSLLDSLALGLGAETDGMTAGGPLHYAMLAVTEAPVPEDTDDSLILSLAAQRGDDLGLAEQAALRGLISAEILAERYEAERFRDSAFDTPLEVLDRISRPAARALIHQVLPRWDLPALKAEAIAAAIRISREDGVLLATAPIFAEQTRAIPATSDLVWFAEDAASLFYATGDIDRARQWHGLLRSAADTDAQAAAGDARLWHLAVLSGESGGALGRSRRGWAAAIEAADDRGAGRSSYLLGLVDAAVGGNTMSSDADLRAAAMAAPAELGTGSSALTLHLLARAALADRLGEAGALSLAALAAAPPGDIAPQSVIAVVRTLQSVGLEGTARRLALESAFLTAQPTPQSQ